MNDTIDTMDLTGLRRDPRTMDWVLVGNKQFIVTLLLGYVYVVKYGGPRFMKGRKPYDSLKPVILLYNTGMVVVNAFFCYKYLRYSYLGAGYSLICQGIDFDSRDESSMGFLWLCWWYFWVRVADFLDTLFFVLRKKDSHVSPLHVIHHFLVVFNGWFGLAYGADGQVALGLVINSFVHVVMYSYYFLSLLGPSVRSYLWWKRYLTQVQIAQFLVILAHVAIPLVKECGYPRSHVLIGIPQVILVLGLFLQFYYNTYTRRQAFKQKRAAMEKAE